MLYRRILTLSLLPVMQLLSAQADEKEKKIEEVVISGQKKIIEQKNGKTIINVENSILSDGSTVLEILQRSPGVTADDDGNISMNGKSSVKIMINGKISYLSPKELAVLLKGMPSSSLKNVELITSPSAKYDASGYGGIINLILKKEKKKGINGNIYNFGAMGRNFRNGAGINLNVNFNRMNVFGSYDYGFRGEEEYRSFTRNFSTTTSNQYSETNQPLRTNKFKARIDFLVSDKTTVGILWDGSIGTYDNYSKGFNNIVDNASGQIVSNAHTNNSHESKWNSQNFNVNLQQKIAKKEHLLTVDFDYSNPDFDANQNLISDFKNTLFQNAYQSQRRGKTPSFTKIYAGKIDYVHSFNEKNKLETGWKSSWVNADNNAKYDTLNMNQWLPDFSTTNHFIYDEKIHAAYSTYSLENGKWNLQGGLRYEYTDATGNQMTTKKTTNKKYGQFFPSFSANYNPNENNTLSFSYSRRIKRPDYDDLNPFRFFL